MEYEKLILILLARKETAKLYNSLVYSKIYQNSSIFHSSLQFYLMSHLEDDPATCHSPIHRFRVQTFFIFNPISSKS